MAAFKVIIVGGSIAGLTLANILERYGIDCVVLEKRAEIAPQLGVSLGLLPHGLRILDQLGIYANLIGITMPINDAGNFGPNGLSLGPPIPLGDIAEEVLGYRMRFMDRKQMLEALYKNILDKSRIRTSAEVFKIEELDEGVQVALKDGSTVHGDLLVGADGVHSRVRSEMWRIADIETTGYGTARLSQAITCAYKCLFGISKRPEGTEDNFTFKSFHYRRSYLCASGPDNKLYFFAFFKNPATTVHPNIPRYTDEDAKELAVMYASDPLWPGTRFGDLYEQSMSCVLVPLEEYVLEKCYYKRVILIGDSFHKVNPLGGQGGNSAIESAAFLSDLLKKTLDENADPSNDVIQHIFRTFQEERRPRTTNFMKSTKAVQSMESLDNWFIKFVQLKFMAKLGITQLAPLLAAASTPGHTLKYLPNSFRSGAVALDEEVDLNPQDRSTVATIFWILLMLLTALLGSLLSHNLNHSQGGNSESEVFQLYKSFLTISVSGLWVIESYRPGLLLSPLFSAIPYIIASFLFGWEIVVPIYFVFHIYWSRSRPFYHPSPRAIDLGAAKALPLALLVAYIPIIPWNTTLLRRIPRGTIYIHSGWMLTSAHATMPLLVHVGKRLYQNGAPKLSVGELLFGTRDLKYVSNFFSIMFLASSTAHMLLMSMFLPGFSFSIAPSLELIQVGRLYLTIVVWCSFVAWDMRRVNLTRPSLPLILLGIMTGSLILGPAAVLAGFWRWRESAWERSRQRK